MNSRAAGFSHQTARAEFEALLEGHLPVMHGVARRLTRSAVEAEDLVQETCLRAYRFFDRFERGTNFRAWILRVLKNLFLNDWNRRQAEPAMSSIDDAESSWEQHVADLPQPGSATDPERELERALLGADLERALRSLPAEFRMVVTLCLVEGLSYQECADVLEIPIGTVMSRLHRGRKALQALLLEDAKAAGLVGAKGVGAAARSEGA